MAKPTKKIVVETRNTYEIVWVEEDIPLASKGGTTKAGSYMVRTSTKPNRIIKNRIAKLENAQAIADQEPPLELT